MCGNYKYTENAGKGWLSWIADSCARWNAYDEQHAWSRIHLLY